MWTYSVYMDAQKFYPIDYKIKLNLRDLSTVHISDDILWRQ